MKGWTENSMCGNLYWCGCLSVWMCALVKSQFFDKYLRSHHNQNCVFNRFCWHFSDDGQKCKLFIQTSVNQKQMKNNCLEKKEVIVTENALSEAHAPSDAFTCRQIHVFQGCPSILQMSRYGGVNI